MGDDKKVYEIGAKVVLHTEPAIVMVVTGLGDADSPDAVQCAWFDSQRHIQIAIFPAAALRLIASHEDNRELNAAHAEVSRLQRLQENTLDGLEQYKVAVSRYKSDIEAAMKCIRPFIGTVATVNAKDSAEAIVENFKRYKESASAVVDQTKGQLKAARTKLIELGYSGPLVG